MSIPAHSITSVYKVVEAIGCEYDPANGVKFLCCANGSRQGYEWRDLKEIAVTVVT
jgi:hypothetical protein